MNNKNKNSIFTHQILSFYISICQQSAFSNLQIFLEMEILSENSQASHRVKVVFLGDKGVGKSSVIRRFINNKFQESVKATIGVDFLSKKIKIDGVIVKMQLWDTAGQQKFRSLVKSYIRDAEAIVFVYDCTEFKTYENIIEWMKVVDEICDEKTYKILVGNKADKEIDQQDLNIKKRSFKKIYPNLRLIQDLIVSAKNGTNIFQIFDTILYKVGPNKKDAKDDLASTILTMSSTMIGSTKKKCCLE